MSVPWEEYFQMVLEEKLLAEKPPAHEDDYISHATQLLEKKQEMVEVEEALQAKKEEFQIKMSALKQRREALDQKEDDLKASMVRFDKFLKDTEAKQSRSLRRAEEGRQTAAQKEAEAMALKKELEGLIKKKEQLERRLHKYRPFARYLEQVVAQSEEFQEIPELMARFSGLSETHAILAEREQALHKAVEDARAELLKLVEEKNDEILHQNNKLADLQLQLEDVRTQALQWESRWVHIQNTAAQKTLLLGQIKMAALNLFQMVCKQKEEVPALAVEDTEGQLEQVQQHFQDLSATLAKLTKDGLDPPLLTTRPVP
ncbi:cilia- and flagella-associated protein 73 [Phascolarctos cinereus]|uniref:Cilia- and flagella-associated protein 73 isoform X2 n=1 Tax=Phascolarctos cinereus TaxID=38626 RepID=A0A6P5JKA7_PHACI|nr:cilia- and flagella-associated protein 73 isoform X2 [Phascolarctos cinereus]XP_020833755.1 cilia- and flagella-associated protein 73 isoform X2 [Phascolarctos cinereus]